MLAPPVLVLLRLLRFEASGAAHCSLQAECRSCFSRAFIVLLSFCASCWIASTRYFSSSVLFLIICKWLLNLSVEFFFLIDI